MALVREAVEADVPAIAVLGERFFYEAGWADVAEWDVGSICETLEAMVDDEDSIVLVAEDQGEIVGIAGGITCPLYFNHAHKTGQELFWYVQPGRRDGTGRMMLEAMEAKAKALGCQSFAMIALDKVNPEATGRVYRRRGYRAAEHSYIKRV